MKVKLIVLSFMLSFLCELNAQNDAFFIEKDRTRIEDNSGFNFDEMTFGSVNGFLFELFNEGSSDGFSFNIFGDDNDNNGFSFGDFEYKPEGMEDSDAPLGNGLLLLTTASLIYLKRKRNNEK